MRFHKLQNVQIALDFLKHRQVPDDRRAPSIHQDISLLSFTENLLTHESAPVLGQTGQHQER